jgi:site-specific recombinase XerD
MNPTALIPVPQPGDLGQDRVGQLVKRVLDGMTSDETRRAYSHALEMFLAFCGREENPTLSAELVASYRISLVGEGKSSSTVGVHLAAIKALTRAAVMAGLMPAEVAAAINDVKGAPRRGNRIGNWLTREQAQELLSLPDRESLKGKRDYAILALLLGCGLRRTELVSEVKIGAIAQRENRWVLVDITGKGNRVRSVAVPAWVKAAIDACLGYHCKTGHTLSVQNRPTGLAEDVIVLPCFSVRSQGNGLSARRGVCYCGVALPGSRLAE